MTDRARNRTVVVTGASAGIGLAAAKALAAQGWNVIAHGRDPERCRQAEASIRDCARGGEVHMFRADLSLMSQTAELARQVSGVAEAIDVLINNAGGTTDAQAVTAEGNERTFAANHLGAFLLTKRLLPLLRLAADKAPDGATRIIAVSSSGHEFTEGFDWTDLQSLKAFVPIKAYCNAKLANVLFTRSLASRLASTGIVAHAMHPGAVDTNFYSYADKNTKAFARSAPLIDAEAGADTIVWLASDQLAGETSGGYWHERQRIAPSASAQDDEAAERLWSMSEALIKDVP